MLCQKSSTDMFSEKRGIVPQDLLPNAPIPCFVLSCYVLDRYGVSLNHFPLASTW